MIHSKAILLSSVRARGLLSVWTILTSKRVLQPSFEASKLWGLQKETKSLSSLKTVVNGLSYTLPLSLWELLLCRSISFLPQKKSTISSKTVNPRSPSSLQAKKTASHSLKNSLFRSLFSSIPLMKPNTSKKRTKLKTSFHSYYPSASSPKKFKKLSLNTRKTFSLPITASFSSRMNASTTSQRSLKQGSRLLQRDVKSLLSFLLFPLTIRQPLFIPLEPRGNQKGFSSPMATLLVMLTTYRCSNHSVQTTDG